MRDHNPVTIEEFNGLFDRGDIDSVPIDHFSDCNNLKFLESSFLSRDGVGPHSPYKNTIRGYPFNQSLLVLDIDGNIYHTDRGANSFIPILTIAGMTDFGFVKFANRAYITPVGMSNEFIYVYEYGDSSPARKAAGEPPATALSGTPLAGGNIEQGIHVIAFVFETDTGFLTQLSPGVAVTFVDGTYSCDLVVPISPNSYVTKRHIVATKAIDPADFTGDTENYQFFFIPDATIEDNTTTTINVNFYDAELLEDASYLEELFSEIPNCAGLNLYHGRLIAWNFPQGNGGENISLIRVSFPGEPEAISEVDGLITLPRDGLPITYCQEQRDVLYIFKQTKTVAATDNGDVPVSWALQFIDQGIGTTAHGLGTIMDSGGVNVDYLLASDFTGIMLFTGTYQLPELTWKIRQRWPNTNRATFVTLQLIVESQAKMIYAVLPDGTMLVGDYNDGLDAKAIKWTPWSFGVKVTWLAILEEDIIRVIIGSRELQDD